MTQPDAERTLPVDDAARIVAHAATFERAWEASGALRLEDFVAQVEERLRGQAFRELLKTEVRLRRQRREQVAARDYLARFPQYDDAIREVCPEVENTGRVDDAAPIPPAGFHVRCPHCHNPVELLPEAPLEMPIQKLERPGWWWRPVVKLLRALRQ